MLRAKRYCDIAGTCEVCLADAYVRTVYLRGSGPPLKIDACARCARRPW